MKKIAIVVQRYGNEVNGGAEYHAKILAEKLSEKYIVEILTTTALDYQNWENYYNEGQETINGIKVIRFKTINKKSRTTRRARRILLQEKKYFRILKFLKIFNFSKKHLNITEITQKNIDDWIVGQGPFCPDLVQYIENHKSNYDVFIFFTYLYYPTVKGMPLVADKSIFVPTAHNEKILFTKAYENLFAIPSYIMYNTDCEKKLIENNFINFSKNNNVAGVGIDKYNGENTALPEVLTPKKYFIYIGRIDVSKGCKKMIKYFTYFIKKHPEYKDYQLVLIGKNHMPKVNHPNLYYTGFIDEKLKYSILKNALAMIMPSFYESLSLVTLEAMNEGIPTIINKNCEVLYSHIIKSNTGAAYTNEKSFSIILQNYINKTNEELKKEAEDAKTYIETNYKWDYVIEKYDKAINFITKD